MQFNSLQKQYSLLKTENANALIKKETEKEIQKESAFIEATSKSKKNKSYKTNSNAKILLNVNSNQLKRIFQRSEILQANRAVITKDDFIGGQIVGN
jgi:hypothetical protein